MFPKFALKSFRLIFLVVLFSSLTIGFAVLQRFAEANVQPQKVKIESIVTLEAKGRGGSNINFTDGATVLTEYDGAVDLSQAEPLALADADFDGDGVPDLIAAYAAGGNGGFLTVHRGNVESIFPNGRMDTISPFFPQAKVFAVLEPPDFLVVGDFNNDGRADAVTARRDGDALLFFKGDGTGSLLSAEKITLPGKVTALAAGDLNRADGLKDLAVGLTGKSGAKVLIFEGANGAFSSDAETRRRAEDAEKSESPAIAGGSEIESFDLPSAATAFAVVSFGESGFSDLAIAAGSELVVIHGRDRQLTLNKESRRESAAVISRQSFDSKIIALTTGKFSDGATNEIVLLTEDGALRTAKMTGAQASRLLDREARKSRQNSPPEGDITTETVAVSLNATSLVRARVSASSSTDDLILLDKSNNQLHILSKDVNENVSASSARLRVSASFDGEAVAALPMRLNKDGLDDIVFLSESPDTAGGSDLRHLAPSVALTAPTAIFVVNSTGNGGDGNNGDGVCADTTGNCTLRAAIQEANALAGADEIRFNLPGAVPFTFAPNNVALSTITETVTIDGTTQPGFSGTPIIEIDGGNLAGNLNDGLNLINRTTPTATNSSNSVIRGLVINRHSNSGIRILNAAVNNVRVEGSFIGTDVTGTIARGNGGGANTQRGGILLGGMNHTIGGTTAAARNVISGNSSDGVNLPVSSAVTDTTTVIAGNFIGTDAGGTADLGNTGSGIRASVNGVTIGGTSAGAGNVISGNSESGVFSSALNSVTEGNRVGTDKDGNADLGNDQSGVVLTISGRIGGTAAGARNLISGNAQDGILLSGTVGVIIQGNAIGTKAGGTTLLVNDRHAIFLTNFTSNSLIGGDTVTPGTCDGPCNILAFGANGKAVSITNASARNEVEQTSLRRSSVSPQDEGNGNKLRKFFLIFENEKFLAFAAFFDLLNDGRTPNDPLDGDTGGPNNLQNFGEVTQAISQGNNVNVQGTLNSTSNRDYLIELYFQSVFRGEENENVSTATFIGSIQATTNGNGDETFSQSFPVQTQPGDRIFALTTDSTTGDTSENSPLVTIAPLTAASVLVSGRVTDTNGRAIRNALVTITDQNGATRSARTNPFGFYQFDGVEVGQTYVVGVSAKSYRFTPLAQAVFVGGEIANLNFVGTKKFRTASGDSP